jgi:hypothetical protein
MDYTNTADWGLPDREWGESEQLSRITFSVSNSQSASASIQGGPSLPGTSSSASANTQGLRETSDQLSPEDQGGLS